MDMNKKVIRISEACSITGTSPFDCLESYPGHFVVKTYVFAEMQLGHSSAPANWDWLIAKSNILVKMLRSLGYFW